MIKWPHRLFGKHFHIICNVISLLCIWAKYHSYAHEPSKFSTAVETLWKDTKRFHCWEYGQTKGVSSNIQLFPILRIPNDQFSKVDQTIANYVLPMIVNDGTLWYG